MQQVRTKLPPDRHSERRFLLPLPSLPLTAAARRRRGRGRTHGTCEYSEAEGGRRGERMGSEILITLAYNPLFLSLSPYESKRVRNKIVERRHLSASFRALACAASSKRIRLCLASFLPVDRQSASRPPFPEGMWSQMCFTILRATMRDQPHCDLYYLKPTVLCTHLAPVPIVCCKWSRTFRRRLDGNICPKAVTLSTRRSF